MPKKIKPPRNRKSRQLTCAHDFFLGIGAGADKEYPFVCRFCHVESTPQGAAPYMSAERFAQSVNALDELLHAES